MNLRGIDQREKRIVLINICLRPLKEEAFLPIGLGYIATALKNYGIKFSLLDIEAHRYSAKEVERYLSDNKYDIYCMGVIVTGYSKVKWLSQKIRDNNKEAIIICGNSVASSIPEIILRKTEVDIGVMGEGDITIIELIDALANNKPLDGVQGICYRKNDKIFFSKKRASIEDINSLPLIDWNIFEVDSYLRRSIYGVAKPYPIPKKDIKAFAINTARGCPYQCTFCYHVFKGRNNRFRSPESIIKEITQLQKEYGINYINFFDELTFFSRKQSEKFADKLIESNLKVLWNADIRPNLFDKGDLGILKKLKQSGCIGLGYSLESGNKEILKHMNKFLDPKEFIRQKRVLDSAGIKTFTSIVLGYPEETLETIRETFRVCAEANIYPSVGYLLPQPGTPMYDYAIQKRIIKNEEEYLLNMGDRQDFTINLTTMDTKEFQNEVTKQCEMLSKRLKLDLSKDDLIKTRTIIQC